MNAQLSSLQPFLLRAKRATYASSADPALLAKVQCPSSRPASHDLAYSEDDWFYLDTYLGGYSFSGEEAVWCAGTPMWSMNYYGTMTVSAIPDGFGDFLKLCLRHAPDDAPYRGPQHFEQSAYCYDCSWTGDFTHFTGTERIFLDGQLVYVLDFHGGAVL